MPEFHPASRPLDVADKGTGERYVHATVTASITNSKGDMIYHTAPSTYSGDRSQRDENIACCGDLT